MTGIRRTAVVLIAALLGGAVPAPAADEWLARDKAVHFGAAAGFGAGGYALAAAAADRERWRIVAGVGSGIGAAAQKELWDRSRGDASWRDFAWGAAGTAAGVTIAWAIDRLRHRGRQAPAARPSRRSAAGSS